jgi:hypothetical protein
MEKHHSSRRKERECRKAPVVILYEVRESAESPDFKSTLPSQKSPSETLDSHDLRVHKSTPVLTASGTAIYGGPKTRCTVQFNLHA